MAKLEKDGYHCLAPNQRGYGRSSKPTRKELYHINFLTTDIASFVEEKANDKKVILIIHDWGSAVGFEFARSYPDMVETIIGINSPSIPGMFKQYQSNPRQVLARQVIAYQLCSTSLSNCNHLIVFTFFVFNFLTFPSGPGVSMIMHWWNI